MLFEILHKQPKQGNISRMPYLLIVASAIGTEGLEEIRNKLTGMPDPVDRCAPEASRY